MKTKIQDSDAPTCACCGARVLGGMFRRSSPACDNICARAKQKGLTRGRQIEEDIVNAERQEQREAANRRLSCYGKAGRNRCEDGADYNRPYLSLATA